MKISIVTTTTTTTPTSKGSYQQIEVVYKNLTYGNKVESKRIMSFGAGKSSFETLATAQQGDIFDVVVVKNDKGYLDWTSMTKGNADSGASQQSPAGQSPTGNATPAARTSTYETPEERAKKQVYIIRQSSVSSAIAALSVGGKSAPKVGEVLEYAKQLEAYVFDMNVGKAEKLPVDDEFPDMPQ